MKRPIYWRKGTVRYPRRLARKFHCPRCGAEPDAPCIGARDKARVSVHIQRIRLARQWIAARRHDDEPPVAGSSRMTSDTPSDK